jgi:hypothetical protein
MSYCNAIAFDTLFAVNAGVKKVAQAIRAQKAKVKFKFEFESMWQSAEVGNELTSWPRYVALMMLDRDVLHPLKYARIEGGGCEHMLGAGRAEWQELLSDMTDHALAALAVVN